MIATLEEGCILYTFSDRWKDVHAQIGKVQQEKPTSLYKMLKKQNKTKTFEIGKSREGTGK